MSIHGTFERMTRERLEEELERLKLIVADGTAIKDYAEYRHTVGKIAGLRMAIETLDGVSSDLEKAR